MLVASPEICSPTPRDESKRRAQYPGARPYHALTQLYQSSHHTQPSRSPITASHSRAQYPGAGAVQCGGMARPTLLTRLTARLQAPGIAPPRTPRPRRPSRRLTFSACSSKSPPPTPRAARGSPCATRCATTFTAAGARASTLRQLTRCGEGTAATSAAPSSLARRSAEVCCTPQRLPPSRRAASLCSQR